MAIMETVHSIGMGDASARRCVARFARVVSLGLPHASTQRRNGRARILPVSSWRPEGVAAFETRNRMSVTVIPSSITAR